MKNVFDADDVSEVLNRIQGLTPSSEPQWGKMNVAQMLAHCNVTYEMALEDKHAKPNILMRMLLKVLVKKAVVNTKPYPRNSRTAPVFIVSDERDFAAEKERLIGYVQKTQQMGEAPFEGKNSLSFGPLTSGEWNNMFYKHLDHHLTQFAV